MLDMHDVLCYIAAVERGKPRALIVSDGRIAQLVEQLTLNQRVQGSSPCAPTIEIKDLARIVTVMKP